MGSSSNTEEVTEVLSLSHISVKPPPFYTKSPQVWFKQLESQFHLAKITSSQTKYHHTLAALPEHIACNLIIDESDNYENLKKVIIESLTANKHQLIEEALNTISLGNLRPSLFVNELKRKFSEINLPTEDTIIKSRLLSALPPNIKTALVGHDSENLDSFARIADSMIAITSNTNPYSIDAIENSQKNFNTYQNQ